MNISLYPRPREAAFLPGSMAVPCPLPVYLGQALGELRPVAAEALGVSVTFAEAEAGGPGVHFAADPSLGPEAYRLSVAPEGVSVTYAQARGAYYALVTLGQLLDQCGGQLPCCRIADAPALAVRGYMLDIGRGKIPTLADLCELVDRMARLKMNQLQLYMEGFCFAYPSHPEVWADRTPITGEEIRYLDAYCRARFIELVPNQNSLGHMTDWIARDEYRHLAEAEAGITFLGRTLPPSTMDAMNPESLALVCELMDDLLPNFSSDTFNVNLDEPFELGQGKNKRLTEEKGEAWLYVDYLKRLHREVCARGKKMYLWGDILIKHPETFADLPEGLTVLDWGYEAATPFEAHAAALEKTGISFLLCPGTAVWTTLTGRTDNMFANVRHAAEAALAHHGLGLLLTAWGDGGHLEYEPLNDPGLAYTAACAWGRTDTAEAEVAAFLNRYVYRDGANLAAQLVMDLGRCNQFEEFPMVNMTIADMNLSMGLLPEGTFGPILDQAVNGILALAGPAAGGYARELANRKEFDYTGAMAFLEELTGRLERLALTGDRGELLRSELENTLRLAAFAQDIHALNACGGKLSPQRRQEIAAHARALGEAFLAAHPGLWVRRNRLHGMEASAAAIRAVMAQLGA